MTTYYVRTAANGGSDAAAGTSAGAAWATIDKAASTVSAGDTVYVGAGVYPESIVEDTSGTSGNQITYIADIDGSKTGDGGLVIVSAWNSPYTGQASRAYCLDINEKEFTTWQGFVFNGTSTSGEFAVGNSSGVSDIAYEGRIFEDCVFIGNGTSATAGNNGNCFEVILGIGATPSTVGMIIRRCQFFGTYGVLINCTNNASAHTNIKWTIENCVFLCGSTGNNAALRVSGTNNTFSIGGITFQNNTCLGGQYCILGNFTQNTTNPIAAYNNLIWGFDTGGVVRSLGTSGSIVDDYNKYKNAAGNVSGVTLGGNSTSNGSMILGFMVDNIYQKWFGWSPYKAMEPVLFSTYTDPAIGGASATYAPAHDIYNNPRPMGRNTDDNGAIEARVRPTQKTSSPIEGTISAQFSGQGYQDFIGVPVAASSTTITVKAKYDANYTGTKPQLIVYNIPGVADQTDTMTAAANTEETLSVTFTPTSVGIVRVRIQSNDTSATGTCHFDELTRT